MDNLKDFHALNNGIDVFVRDMGVYMVGYTNGNRVRLVFPFNSRNRELSVDYRGINSIPMQLGNHANYEGICNMYAEMVELYYNKYVGTNKEVE